MKAIATNIIGLILVIGISIRGFGDEPKIGEPINVMGVENVFRVTTTLYSGSEPEGDAAFSELAKLGVKTILSVDGSEPDVEAARKFGLLYIHLPLGYGGVSKIRIAELTKLGASTNGPFFVHCHHGKHRGPAAVAIMCLASENWTSDRAEAWLREAGTSEDYPGLYRSAREFKPPTATELAAVGNLPETTKASSVVEAMVAIDERFDRLKKAQKTSWKILPGQSELSPTHEATMLREQFREMARMPDVATRPKDYRLELEAAERAAENLGLALRDSNDVVTADAAFKTSMQSCVACHKEYRNQ